MRQLLLCYLSFFLAFHISFVTRADETKSFRNIRHGYELSYPNGWVVDTNENTDNPYRETLPEEARNLTFFEKGKSGAENENWLNLDIAPFKPFIAGIDKNYAESKKTVNEMKQNRQNNYYTRIEEFNINGNKFEISAQGKKLESEYKLHAFLYCEQSKNIFGFFTTKKLDPSFDIFSDSTKKITLEKIYTSEQLIIIRSFRCPKKNYIYKKARPKSKK